MKPSILTLLDADDLEEAKFASILEDEGFDLQLLTMQEALTSPFVRAPVFAVVLILSQFDPDRIKKAVSQLSEYMKGSDESPVPLIACGPEWTYKDEDFLRNQSGFNKVIIPAAWEPEAIAQRVLAALLGGFTIVRDGVTKESLVEFKAGEKLYLECNVRYEGAPETRRLVGGTQIMRELFTKVKAYRDSREQVLIKGETGTGKELFAAAIAAKAKNYETINIAEIPPDLVATELFGHARGVFTSAFSKTKGILLKVGSGTLFIDEIGDLTPHDQALLLRVLSNREFRPLGEDVKPLQARLIFATNKPLEEMCFHGEFRQDLYQRLRIGHRFDELPPLSKKKGDLELLVKEIFGKWRADRVKEQNIKGQVNTQPVFELRQSEYDKVIDLCIKHEFRGNVRSLQGILGSCFSDSLYLDQRFNIKRLEAELRIDREHAAAAANRSDQEREAASGLPSVKFDPSKDTWHEFSARAGLKYFTEVYRAAERSLSDAAKVADVSRSTVRQHLPQTERRRQRRQ